MAVGQLVVGLGLDAAEFTRGLTKAQVDMERSMAGIRSAAVKIGAALGAAVSVTVFKDMIVGAIDAADKLNDLSKQTGVAVETLGGLGFAASQAGGSLEGTAAGLGKLNKSIAEAASGNEEASQVFKALGISVRDSSGAVKDAGAVYLEVADKFATYADGPEKAAIALKLFGKAGAEQISILNEGGRALQENIEYYRRFGGVTTETAKAADEFNDTLGRINLISQSFGRTLAAYLLPILQAVADEFLKAKETGGAYQAVIDGIKGAFQAVIVVASDVIFVLASIGREIGAVAAQVGALARLDIKGFTAIGDAVKEDGARARKELDDFQARVLGVQKTIAAADYGNEGRNRAKTSAPGLPGGGGRRGGGRAREIKETISETQRYLESLQRQIESTRDLSAVEQVLADIQAKRIKGIDAQGAGKALDLAAQIDAAKAQKQALEDQERTREAVRQQIIRSIDAAYDEAEQIEGVNARYREQTELLGVSRDAEYAIERARISSAIALKEQALAATQANDTTGALTDALERQIDALREQQGLLGLRQAKEIFIENTEEMRRKAQELTDVFAGNFEDSFAAFLDGSKSAKEAFKDFANGVIADLARIAARQAATAIFGDANGQGGVDWGAVISSIAGSFSGGKASGGYVPAGTWGVVGENGPEMVYGGKGGASVTPNRAMGATTNINVNVTATPGMTRETALQQGRDIGAGIDRAKARNG